MINGSQECRLIRRRVAGFVHYRPQLESRRIFGGHRNTQGSSTDPKHEVDLFGGDGFGRADKVAFVFTILVINNDDHATGFQCVDRLLD